MYPKWNAKRSDGQSHYEVQSEILREVLALEGRPLDELLQRMRATGESCLYLSGSRLDHEACFGSRDLGLALSVLPEDGEKAAEPGYHPGSSEVYVVFQGSLVVETLQEGSLKCEPVEAAALVIPAGRCHRVRRQPGNPAASLIVKTNLQHQPGVVRCPQCACYSQAEDCPLYRSWQAEK